MKIMSEYRCDMQKLMVIIKLGFEFPSLYNAV